MAHEFSWMPLYCDDFLTSRRVMTMTNEQVGMFLKLLIHEWKDGPLPDDADALRALCGGNADALQSVMRCFVRTDEGWVNERLEAVRSEQIEKAEAKSESGKKAAKARWRNKKRRHADALPAHSDRNATGMRPVCHIEEEEEYISPPNARAREAGLTKPESMSPVGQDVDLALVAPTTKQLRMLEEMAEEAGTTIEAAEQAIGLKLTGATVTNYKRHFTSLSVAQDRPGRRPMTFQDSTLEANREAAERAKERLRHAQ